LAGRVDVIYGGLTGRHVAEYAPAAAELGVLDDIIARLEELGKALKPAAGDNHLHS